VEKFFTVWVYGRGSSSLCEYVGGEVLHCVSMWVGKFFTVWVTVAAEGLRFVKCARCAGWVGKAV